ncbi:DUF2071 domain-containing protein [Streptomyces sp. NPDC093223]|uniref:DUF2071 domain-containing protein n=1 Tax=Streptomyces sp. NPDC093223 TaxID=3366033 RepID=UPI00382A7A24
MRQPRLASVIERRLLVNYRIDPAAAARLLPQPLRPHLVHGHAVGGICLLRLGHLRPAWALSAFGLRSENAAHRIAVEWDGPGGIRTGVYIPRRDSASRLNAWAGGRVFPGSHGRADFDVHETPGRIHVALATHDGDTRAAVTAEPADELYGSRLFADLAEASRFFRSGATGFSPGVGGRLEGIELRTRTWHMEPCRIRAARSSYFDDPDRFPPGTAILDSALIMRDLPVHWQPLAATGTGHRTPPAG